MEQVQVFVNNAMQHMSPFIAQAKEVMEPVTEALTPFVNQGMEAAAPYLELVFVQLRPYATKVGSFHPYLSWMGDVRYFFAVILAVFFYLIRSLSIAIKERNYPPRYNYFFNALTGAYDMKNHSVLKMIRKGYDKCGEVYTIHVLGQRVTFMTGPEAQTAMFSAKDKQLSQREVYKFTIPIFGKNIVYDAPYSRMYEQLKFLKHGVSSHAMKTHAEKIIDVTIDYFKTFDDEGEIDMYQCMSDLIIKTASICLLGKEIQKEVHGGVGEIYQRLSDGMKHISYFFPNLPTSFHRQRDQAKEEMCTIFRAGLKKRKDAIKAGMKKPDDLLQGLIDAKYRDGSSPSESEICGLLIAMLFAGQHTSNITATWTGYRILGAWDKIGDDIMKEQKQVLDESKGKVTFDALEKMEFLNNCVKETLRMYPPLIVLMRKVLIPLEYKGYVIPEGDIVATAPPVGNRLESVWTNPNEFDPDRYRRKEGAEPNAYVSFGGGRHQCLGQNFGLLQIKVIWSCLLRNFEFELIDPLPNIDYGSIVAGLPYPCKTRMRYKRRKNPIGGN